MTTLTKVLIGAAAVTVVGAVTVVIVKNNKKEKDVADAAVEQDHKDDGIIKRIKTFVTKKVIRILGWVALHMQQIEAAGTLIGFVATIVSITGAIRDFVKGNDLNNKLDVINQKLDDIDGYYRNECRSLYEDHNILANNQAKIAKAVGVPVKEEIA